MLHVNQLYVNDNASQKSGTPDTWQPPLSGLSIGGRSTSIGPKARWEQIVERPLNAAALALLIACPRRVIGDLQGGAAVIAHTIIFATWLVFFVNYLANMALAADHERCYGTRVFELPAVTLPGSARCACSSTCACGDSRARWATPSTPGCPATRPRR